jgi:hypothetical protein
LDEVGVHSTVSFRITEFPTKKKDFSIFDEEKEIERKIMLFELKVFLKFLFSERTEKRKYNFSHIMCIYSVREDVLLQVGDTVVLNPEGN